ncbi:MAG: hypothetical protein CME60_00475 [Halobacteriovoraceae bacterium]|nr:hypothetical protein [Halobacteriovoraceae bacterium]
MIKVVVFGYGHLGRWHVDKVVALKEEGLCELVGVVDHHPETKKKLSDKGIEVATFKSFEECNVEYDAGIIVTPTSTHFELASQLIAAKKHVFCEKPMTSTYEEATQLKQMIEEAGIKLQVGHSERYHQVWPELKDKVDYFKGTPILRLERQAPFKGRATDVDVVQDLMIHDIDLMMFILGDRPISVEAFGKKQRTDKWDFVRALFKFNSGAVATISVGRNHTEEIRNFEVVNDFGCLQVDLFRRQLREARSSATEESEFVVTKEYPPRDHLLEEQRLFYNSIAADERTVVNEEDGLNAVYVVEQVLNSLELEKSVSW